MLTTRQLWLRADCAAPASTPPAIPPHATAYASPWPRHSSPPTQQGQSYRLCYRRV